MQITSMFAVRLCTAVVAVAAAATLGTSSAQAGYTAYIAASGTSPDKILKLDIDTWAQTGSVDYSGTGSDPVAVTLSANGQTLYASDITAGAVSTAATSAT